MKVIGKTDRGFILQASNAEVANLLGEYSEYQLDREKKTPIIGATINVSEMYHHYNKLKLLESERKKCAEQLRAAAMVIESCPVIYQEPQENN